MHKKITQQASIINVAKVAFVININVSHTLSGRIPNCHRRLRRTRRLHCHHSGGDICVRLFASAYMQYPVTAGAGDNDDAEANINRHCFKLLWLLII